LRADLADAAVFVANGGDLMAPLGFDSGELEFFGENLGQFIEGKIDFHEMMARVVSALPFAGAFADGIAFLAVTRADAAGIVAIAEMGEFDAAEGDADEVLSLFSDEFALGEEFAQVVADSSFDDLPEALVIFFDL